MFVSSAFIFAGYWTTESEPDSVQENGRRQCQSTHTNKQCSKEICASDHVEMHRNGGGGRPGVQLETKVGALQLAPTALLFHPPLPLLRRRHGALCVIVKLDEVVQGHAKSVRRR